MSKLPDLRLALAEALYPTNANLLPAVCERFGLSPGTRDEAMSRKTTYVQKRLVSLSLSRVLEIAQHVMTEYPDEGLARAIERAAPVHPADETIAITLTAFDEAGVHAVWKRALERRGRDPEGALTSARTLLETVCKHILEASNSPPDERDDLPTLYKNVARVLNLAPDQHTEQAFKRILGSCQSVVEDSKQAERRSWQGTEAGETCGKACRARGQSGRFDGDIPGRDMERAAAQLKRMRSRVFEAFDEFVNSARADGRGRLNTMN